MVSIGTSGTTLRFPGFVHGLMVEWDPRQCASFKSMPEHTVFILCEGWGATENNKFDHIEVDVVKNPSLKRTPYEPDMQEFLTEADLVVEFDSLVEALKTEATPLTDQKLGKLCYAEPTDFAARFEAKGVKIFICKARVNAGQEPCKDFLWLEFSAHETYVPEEAVIERRTFRRSSSTCIMS